MEENPFSGEEEEEATSSRISLRGGVPVLAPVPVLRCSRLRTRWAIISWARGRGYVLVLSEPLADPSWILYPHWRSGDLTAASVRC